MLSESGVVYPSSCGGGDQGVKAQVIALATKWIFKAFLGNEPWKVLVRNNIERSIIEKGKVWDNNIERSIIKKGKLVLSPLS